MNDDEMNRFAEENGFWRRHITLISGTRKSVMQEFIPRTPVNDNSWLPYLLFSSTPTFSSRTRTPKNGRS